MLFLPFSDDQLSPEEETDVKPTASDLMQSSEANAGEWRQSSGELVLLKNQQL